MYKVPLNFLESLACDEIGINIFQFISGCSVKKSVTHFNVSVVNYKTASIKKFDTDGSLSLTIPSSLQFIVAMPNATPPVECTILSNVSLQNSVQIQTGLPDISMSCMKQEEFYKEGLYKLEFALRYMDSVKGTVALFVNATTGTV